MTKNQLKLLTNTDMLRVVEKGIKGRIYHSVYRYCKLTLCKKHQNTEVFFGQYFGVFGLNMEIYRVKISISNSNTGTY